jgi:hypothetical protein
MLRVLHADYWHHAVSVTTALVPLLQCAVLKVISLGTASLALYVYNARVTLLEQLRQP